MVFGRVVPGGVEVTDEHVRVTPPRYWTRRGGWVAAGIALAALVGVCWALAHGERDAAVVSWAVQVLMWGSFAAQGLGPWDTVVDARGVHRPWRRLIAWDHVAAVPAPARFDESVRLRFADDRSVGIGVPVRYAADVARIGGVPFEGEATAGPGGGEQPGGCPRGGAVGWGP